MVIIKIIHIFARCLNVCSVDFNTCIEADFIFDEKCSLKIILLIFPLSKGEVRLLSVAIKKMYYAC